VLQSVSSSKELVMQQMFGSTSVEEKKITFSTGAERSNLL
jgi:hypothetical protein